MVYGAEAIMSADEVMTLLECLPRPNMKKHEKMVLSFVMRRDILHLHLLVPQFTSRYSMTLGRCMDVHLQSVINYKCSGIICPKRANEW